VLYADVAQAVAPTGFVARGGFVLGVDDQPVPPAPDGGATRTVVVIGNVGGAVWPSFRAAAPAGPDPLDTWTRSVLAPIADRLGATYVHPSDQPYQPFQRWAQRADDVFPSPIGLLVHPVHGLWHAYRGAFLFACELDGLPRVGDRRSPCLDCADTPCLRTCPVGAFGPPTAAGPAYDVAACHGHLRSGVDPQCLRHGCAARLACPVGRHDRYGPDQMRFHMAAFAGIAPGDHP
jgi:hypothetical protein